MAIACQPLLGELPAGKVDDQLCFLISAPIAPNAAFEVGRLSCRFSRTISFYSSIEYNSGICLPSFLLVNQGRRKDWE